MPITAQKPGLVAFQDTVYDLRANGLVFKYQGTGKSWQQIGGNGNVTQVAASGNGNVYIYDSQDAINAYKGSDGTTTTIDRIPERKTLATSAKFVYKLHIDQNRVYRYSSKDWNLVDDGVKAVAIAVDEDDTLYQLHADGRISKYLGSEGWQEIDSTPNVRSIVAGGGKLYKLHKDGGVYVHLEDYDWDRIDKSDTVQVVAGPAGVFQKRGDGTIWKYDEAAKKWDKIDASANVTHDIAVGNTLYLRNSAGNIWKYDLTAKSWQSIL